MNLATSLLATGRQLGKEGAELMDAGRMLLKGLAICEKTLNPADDAVIDGRIWYPLLLIHR